MAAHDEEPPAAEETLPQMWSEFKMDQRVVEAIRSLGWRKPTTVQRACITHMLRGRDVCVQSRTGSGKTGAFAVPLAHRLAMESRMIRQEKPPGPVALVLVPSVELCAQTEKVINDLCRYLQPRAIVENLCSTTPQASPFGSSFGTGTSSSTKGGHPTSITPRSGIDALVSTPAAIAKHLRSKSIDEAVLKNLRMMVIDEADLLMSTNSLRLIQSLLPTSGVQRVLLSATLTEGVATMRGQLLRNPTHITLTDDEGPAISSLSVAKRGYDAEEDTQAVIESRLKLKDQQKNTLRQSYLVATDECHHHTLLYGLYRLKLIEGKTLIFVDDEDTTYRLQHFLEQLSIACIVYDQKLPMNVRLDMLRRFQSGEVNTLVCTDATLEKAEQAQLDVAEEDKESGLSRGIDFSKIMNVIIFDGLDAPTSINFARYTHRVGRTGRAGNAGLSILLQTVRQQQNTGAALREYAKSRGERIRPFRDMDRQQAAQLQYRVDTALAKVTRNATKRLRVATVASELARSKQLASQMNQNDTEALKKVVSSGKKAVATDPELTTVPKYMRMNQVESKEDYADRVKGGAEVKANVFARVAKRRREDPLKQAVARARRIEK